MDDTNPDTIPMFKKGIKKRIIKASTIFLNLNTSTDYLLGRIEDDSPLSGYNIKSMNPKTYKMLNNFLMLKEKEKDECLWYSEAIRKRDFDK